MIRKEKKESMVSGYMISQKNLTLELPYKERRFLFLISLFKTYEISVSFTRSEKKAMDNLVYIINKIKFEIK